MEKQSRSQKWIEYLEAALAEERDKVKGYEQIAKIHGAYIAILLKKLGATEENKLHIPASEVKAHIETCEVRAEVTDNGYSLYYTDENRAPDTRQNEARAECVVSGKGRATEQVEFLRLAENGTKRSL